MPKITDSHITFVLRDSKAKGYTPIIGIVRFHNTRFKIPTGYKILVQHWHDKINRVKSLLAATDRVKINERLQTMENAVRTAFDQLEATNEVITKETLKSKIQSILAPYNPKLDSNEPALFTFITRYIDTSPERINPNSGRKIEYRTIQKYKTVLSVLREFSGTYDRVVDFHTIDLTFYGDFTKFLTTKDFSTNNIGKYIQTLKTFLNDATNSGFNNKLDYKSHRFKVLHEKSDSVYLDEQELSTLFELDLSQNARLDRVRDLFLVGAYTGLRFSDLTNLKAENINNGRIRIEQRKTMDRVVIPCHQIVTNILNKYKGELPHSISNQKMNDYIKEIGLLAGITQNEIKAITKGGKRIKKNFKKYELISTHTARRSFATNMYWSRIPTITIMKITGHQTEKAFLRYIKLSEEQHADIVQSHWDKKPEMELEVH